MTDDKFERGRKVAESLNNRAIGREDPEITGTGISEDDDMRYFIERAVEEDRRKATRRGLHWGRRGSRRGRRERE